jgi:hypothetical protein
MLFKNVGSSLGLVRLYWNIFYTRMSLSSLKINFISFENLAGHQIHLNYKPIIGSVQILVRLALSGFRGLFRQGEIITNPDKPRLEMGGTESPLPHILSRGRRDFLLRPSCKKTVAIRLQCDDEKIYLDKAYYGPYLPVTYVSTLVVTVRSSCFIISCCWTHGEWALLCGIRILCLQKAMFLIRNRKVECLFSLVKSDGWNRVEFLSSINKIQNIYLGFRFRRRMKFEMPGRNCGKRDCIRCVEQTQSLLCCHHHHTSINKGELTLSLLMLYIYGAPCKVRNFNVVYIWTCVWQR